MRLVRAGVARGRAWGLTWQSALAGFFYAIGDVSPNWDGQPELHTSLLHQRASAVRCEHRVPRYQLRSLRLFRAGSGTRDGEMRVTSVNVVLPRFARIVTERD